MARDPRTNPVEKCAAASCPHARAVTTTHTSRRARSRACSSRDAAASVSEVQANVAENGSASTTDDPARPAPMATPPIVAAARDSLSLRQNQYMPSPARIGCNTMNHRTAAPQGSAEYSSMAGAYIHPDCGSAANGVPPIAYGFQAGTWPAARALPREQWVGSHN